MGLGQNNSTKGIQTYKGIKVKFDKPFNAC